MFSHSPTVWRKIYPAERAPLKLVNICPVFFRSTARTSNLGHLTNPECYRKWRVPDKWPTTEIYWHLGKICPSVCTENWIWNAGEQCNPGGFYMKPSVGMFTKTRVDQSAAPMNHVRSTDYRGKWEWLTQMRRWKLVYKNMWTALLVSMKDCVCQRYVHSPESTHCKKWILIQGALYYLFQRTNKISPWDNTKKCFASWSLVRTNLFRMAKLR